MVRFSALLIVLMGACVVDPCETRQDLLDTPDGLVLTEEEHAAGWGNDRCIMCHPLVAIHQGDCADRADLDMEAVQDTASDGEYKTCVACHGDNGVEP